MISVPDGTGDISFHEGSRSYEKLAKYLFLMKLQINQTRSAGLQLCGIKCKQQELKEEDTFQPFFWTPFHAIHPQLHTGIHLTPFI